ncbi:MAG TPA: hypothetical protein VFK02_30725 [Kofleriaceae bacterium]|nr:hypothetical protein [Kofleriaceae bacterium]
MLAATSRAGTVVGRLELPPAPERGPVIAKGFLDRTENPLAEVKKPNIAPYFVVALEGAQKTDSAPAEVAWDLVGESFARPVIAVPVGAEVVIKNQTKISRTLSAAEDPKLIAGPLNPTGSKSFRATEPAIYTIGDKDAPHLRGKIVVVATTHVATVDDGGRFEMTDVPDGSYKLRIFYYDPAGEARGRRSGWLSVGADVNVVSRGKGSKTEVNAKVPAAELAARPAPGPAPGAAPGKK